jgi:hypothetical protein
VKDHPKYANSGNNRGVKRLCLFLVGVTVTACSSTTTPPVDASAEASDAMSNDSGADSGVLTCVQPENSSAPNVTIFKKTTTAPTPLGGTPYPGLYQLTAYNYYTTTTGMDCCARVALRVTDVEILKSAFYSSSGVSKIAVTYTVNGTNLSTKPVCGTLSGDAGDWPFTAVGDMLTLFSNSGGVNEEIYQWVGP